MADYPGPYKDYPEAKSFDLPQKGLFSMSNTCGEGAFTQAFAEEFPGDADLDG